MRLRDALERGEISWSVLIELTKVATAGSEVFELVSIFNPASEIDRDLLLAALLTPFWGGPPGQRPLFVITGREGIGIHGRD